MKRTIVFIMLLMLLSACGGESSGNAEVDEAAEAVAGDLNTPWIIEQGDGGLYLSEREGVLKWVADDEMTMQSLELSESIHASGEGGLLGFALHPNVPERAYVYYTYMDDGEKNRVALLERSEDTWYEVETIIGDIPGGNIHNGGRMEIGPDDLLYITTGDAGNGDYSQDTENLAGKILRLELDGEIPEDNPFGSPVYSYGHRNPQGMAWDDDGTLYATEHGASGHDEINIIEAGNNYGWPVIEGNAEEEGMETPLHHTGEDTWAPSGMDYREGTLYIAALRGERVIAYDLESETPSVFYDEGSRMRDVHIDGDILYALTNNTDGRGEPEEGDDHLVEMEIEE